MSLYHWRINLCKIKQKFNSKKDKENLASEAQFQSLLKWREKDEGNENNQNARRGLYMWHWPQYSLVREKTGWEERKKHSRIQFLKVFAEIKSKYECTRDTELLGSRKELIFRIHKAKVTEIQGDKDNSTVIARDCNITLSKWIEKFDRPIRKLKAWITL